MKMPLLDPATRFILLATLTGLVDTLAFLIFGGFFAASIGGDVVRLAVGVTANWSDVQLSAAAVLAFIGGAAAAAVLQDQSRWPGGSAVAAMICGLLSMAALFASFERWWPLWLMAAAMGAVHLAPVGEKSVSATTMLARLGEGLAGLARKRKGGLQAADPELDIALLAPLGLLAGGMIAVGLYARWGLPALWVPAGLAGLMTLFTWRPRQPAINPDEAPPE
jgi:uncharacterized membrane protein YoaK (UPF0700 family)